jgi:hypothetical protein
MTNNAVNAVSSYLLIWKPDSAITAWSKASIRLLDVWNLTTVLAPARSIIDRRTWFYRMGA